MLHHKRHGVEGVYDKNQELELRASGFAAWERHIVNLALEAELADQLDVPVEAIAAAD